MVGRVECHTCADTSQLVKLANLGTDQPQLAFLLTILQKEIFTSIDQLILGES